MLYESIPATSVEYVAIYTYLAQIRRALPYCPGLDSMGELFLFEVSEKTTSYEGITSYEIIR